jgi:hypothetical protein
MRKKLRGQESGGITLDNAKLECGRISLKPSLISKMHTPTVLMVSINRLTGRVMTLYSFLETVSPERDR